MEELHQQRASQMIKSTEGSAWLLHKVTEAHSMEGWSTHPEERRRGWQAVGPLCSKEERMGKALTVCRKRAEHGGQASEQ